LARDLSLRNWINLNIFYLGSSKKHQIFRAKVWNSKFESIFRKPVYNQEYEKVGYVKDIFGPVKAPFISIKPLPDVVFNPNDKLYAKIR